MLPDRVTPRDTHSVTIRMKRDASVRQLGINVFRDWKRLTKRGASELRPTELTIRKDRADLSVLRDTLDRVAAEHGISGKSLIELQVVLDEIISNTVKYAWPEGGTARITGSPDRRWHGCGGWRSWMTGSRTTRSTRHHRSVCRLEPGCAPEAPPPA
jgi:hypothetical protein